jgi:4-deoxy-L-threo-5-hexosulose-uronate ketol-isomerase
MDIREDVSSDHSALFNTAELRKRFLVKEILRPDEMTLVYSHIDRIILGGVMPVTKPVSVPSSRGEALSADFFLQRRELGLINIGGPGWVKADDRQFNLASEEAAYIGQGCRELVFVTVDETNPAKFYYNSAVAHTAHPSRKVTIDEALTETLGDSTASNRRTIYKYFVPRHPPDLSTRDGHDQAHRRQHVEYNAMPHTRQAHGSIFLFPLGRKRCRDSS